MSDGDMVRIMRKALALAKARIEYLGVVAGERHWDENEKTYLPIIDAALSPPQRGDDPLT